MKFYLNFNDFYDEKNAKKLVVLGVILLSIGFYCITRKYIGIKIFSWGLSLVFLYGAWISLKKVNELSRYASSKEINMARLNLAAYLAITILLIIFPKYVNMFLSVVLGSIIVYRQLSYLFQLRAYAGNSYFSMWNVIKLFMGVALIVSPLFLSKFLVSILSFIAILFGFNFIITGVRLINERGY